MGVFFSICLNLAFGQTNSIDISATLMTETDELQILQDIVYHNTSDSILSSIFLHNWSNAYKDKNTPLAKRFIENYSKSFHFTKEKNRGHSEINSISVNFDIANWVISKDHPDIIEIKLKKPLHPGESAKITATFTVKIPHAKFTQYGVQNKDYNLRYWYLIPAIYDDGWKTYSNLDMDDLYLDYTNYDIKLNVPEDFIVNSDIIVSNKISANRNQYHLIGKNKLDIELVISRIDDFSTFEFDGTTIKTNLIFEKINETLKWDIIRREFYFLQLHLGKIVGKNLFLNKTGYRKNPVYGFSQLPTMLAPFSNAFEWDIQMFKVLSRNYIDNVLLFNRREDAWLADGIQTYIMMKYVETYYPEVKAIGGIADLWGVRNFNLAKIYFNDKYPYVYQFAARKNLDQPLTMRADSLSNFNRKIVNKYKAGIGLKYLENYYEINSLRLTIWNFFRTNSGKRTQSSEFLDVLKSEFKKDISWFEGDYLNTNKKIDYTIQDISSKPDSLEITILNKRNISTPIQLYGLHKKEIKFKTWLKPIDSTFKIAIPQNGIDKLSLNYESQLPEFNLRNNWKGVKKKILNRPLQVKFLKDIENPYYNQVFYTPVVRFNYYDGIVAGMAISNKTFLNKSFQYKFTPSFSTKSKTFSGSYSMIYEYLPENKKVNKFLAGISGNNYQYAENLTYNSLYPFALVEFKRKSLRSVSSKSLLASFAVIDRERSPEQTEHIETNKYNVFNLSYGYAKPEIINDIRFSTGLQVASKFSKLSLTARFRKLTNTNRQLDFRFFAGAFLTNKTETDYFSFALDRPTDYLFQYDYFGRSETSGFFSQQIIINEGGFKSKLAVPYANQWISTLNTSIGLWRWFEVYNDVGFVKNKNEKVYFAHENGIRLNFIQDILEVYFPLHSNLGWEIDDPQYSSKIRFVLVLKPKRIFNFIKRGFY